MTTMTRRRSSRIASTLLLLVLTALLLVAQQKEARTPSSETEEGNSSSNNLRGSKADATTTNLSEVEYYNDERDQAVIEQRQRALQERVARRRAARSLQKQQQREQQDGQLQGQQPKPYGSEDNGRIQSFTSFMEKYNDRHHRARMYFDTSEEAEHAHALASSGKVDELRLYLEGADSRSNTEEEEVEDRYHLLHSRDNDGWTLLHEAIFQQHAYVVEYLLTLDEVLYASSDSDDEDDDDDDSTRIKRDDDLLNAMNFQGQTPLDLALEIAGDDADNKIVHLMIVNGSTLPPLLLTEDTNREKKAIKFVQQKTKEDYPVRLDRHM
eukprot:CAMPEP_0113463964 /NCGR_PEP_ID=MMETSP0014_2-20120614/12944_1 /TAXON_ID=2857 /ORGANISM="Nitzschia sp." /LENGTH=324 /DNA_ID=CAMNT_0000356005 /DNA_START=97 /DNA_END=1071 /DNA_ORIENTATION=- /assembly_acc=CAM_ASM_000159